MSMPVTNAGAMTVDAFYGFVGRQPERERWELIAGEPVLKASSGDAHERVLLNLAAVLWQHRREAGSSWEVMLSFGVRVSDHDRLEPDVLVVPAAHDPAGCHCNDVVAAFEIVAAATAERDLERKRAAYASLPWLNHYVVIAQDAVEVTVFGRDDGFAKHTFRSGDDVAAVTSLGVRVPVGVLYRDGGGHMMTVDDFYAFTDPRPDHERWELLGGEPVLTPSRSLRHQRILTNLIGLLGMHERAIERCSWEVLPGFGVRVSDHDRPQPDVMVLPFRFAGGDRHCDDAIVTFEVLSPDTQERDLGCKRTIYQRLATLSDYVVIAEDAIAVTVFSRDDGFQGRSFRSLDDGVELRSLGISIPVAEIYRGADRFRDT